MRYITNAAILWLLLATSLASAGMKVETTMGAPNIFYMASDRSLAEFWRHYTIVFFYGEHCPYCLKFAPVLKQYASLSRAPVQAVSVGLITTTLFTDSMPATPELITQFFHSQAELVVPAVFILNLHNYHAYQVTKGALTYPELAKQLAQLIPKIITHEQGGQ